MNKLIALFYFFLLSFSSFAQGYHIKNYHVDLLVNYDGSIEVTENIKANFAEPKRGIIRNIPIKYLIGGKEHKLQVSDIEVKGYKKKVSTKGNDLMIRIGDPNVYLEGDQDYVIKYRVGKAIIFNEKFCELYYDVIPHKWDTNIDEASFNVSFEKPYALTNNVINGYRGSQGSQDTITMVSLESNGARGIIGPLDANEGATLAIKIPFDVVRPPSTLEKLFAKYGNLSIGTLYLSIFSFLFYYLWNKYGKDYEVIKAVRYTPPIDINPSEAGAIIDGTVDNIDILSMIPYWAQQGHIKVKKINNKWSKDDYEIQKILALKESATRYEHNFFNKLFETGDNVKVSDLSGTFYNVMNNASSGIKSRLDELNIYYKVSDRVQIVSGLLTILILLLGLVIGLFTKNMWLIVAGGICGVIGIIATIYMRKRTMDGLHHYQEVLGFKEFIKAADKDRIERLLKEDPMYFEKTLPYAMVFGYAKSWGSKFEGLLTSPPSWYVSNTPYVHGQFFNSGDFSKEFSSDMEEIKGVFTSYPESSSGGGFGDFSSGGGGFSGGGFGGGGGSSW
jgi:uncharacterized membrane protein YgcG